MEAYKLFHKQSSLSLENAKKFSDIASWVASMRDFSKQLAFQMPEEWKLKYKLKYFGRELNEPIASLLNSRRSIRNFSTTSISVDDFAFIVNNSLGVSHIEAENIYFTYPTSGGIESIIPIICVSNVDEIEQGVYYYNAKEFSLFKISDFSLCDYEILTSSTQLASQSAFSIHLFSSTKQKCYKYQDRGYRFLLLECGHIMQSVHLCSSATGIGCVMSGGGYDIPMLPTLHSLMNDDDILVLYECFLESV